MNSVNRERNIEHSNAKRINKYFVLKQDQEVKIMNIEQVKEN